MARIVRTANRNKRPPPTEKSMPSSLDRLFLFEGQETTLREQCQRGFVTVVRYKSGPYAAIMRPPRLFVQIPISEADFSTLEGQIRKSAPPP
jgi:hypothetical protein